MANKSVGLERVDAARALLKRLPKQKPPAIRTDHYSTFLAKYSEIKALRKRGVPWHEIRLRYYGNGDDVPHIRSLQRYFEAAKTDKSKRGA